MRITSFTPMKDEGPFILEWLAYHRLIGINDPIVLTNDCSDGTDLILERLDEMGLLRHMTNPSVYIKSGNHHWEAVRFMNTQKRLSRSDWVISFDVDEFICVNAGEGRLSDLFEAVDGANVITINQRNFGCAGIMRYAPELQMRQFVYGWEYIGAYNGNQSQRGLKSLTHKSANAAYFGNHSPQFRPRAIKDVRVVNGSGKELPGEDLTQDLKFQVEPDYGYDLVQLNHYVLRSMEDFVLKSARGNANHPDRQADMKYWRRYNHNDVKDERILRWADRVEAQMAEWLTDPALKALHEGAIKFHRKRFKELLQNDDYRGLRRAIRQDHRSNPGLARLEDSPPTKTQTSTKDHAQTG